MLAAWVLAGFVCAGAAPFLVRLLGQRACGVFALYPFTALLLALVSLPAPASEEVLFSWLPQFGLSWGTYADGLARLFAVLIGGIGVLIVLYAGDYLHDHPHLGRFYAYLIGFTASMLGLVLAHNFFMLLVCWELTSVFSYLLIGFEAAEEKSRKAAWQALLTTSLGGVALLVGFLLLERMAGTWTFASLLSGARLGAAKPEYVPALALVLLAAFTKSAQFPFHFWLPAAMAAPTPVSAYLHSATMVKAGVFLLTRLTPVLGDSPLWQVALTSCGAATMLTGALLAVPQSDGKLLLAYSTVSALGTLVFLLGAGTPEAVSAAVVFLFAHALYKGGLFLSVGIVDHATGSRDFDQLSGLGRALPAVTAIMAILLLSLAGIPPTFGFVAKEQLLETTLHHEPAQALVALAATLVATACQVAIAGVLLRPFVVLPTHSPAGSHHHGTSALLFAGPALLAAASLLAVALASPVSAMLLEPAARAVHGSARVTLALWHGLTPALTASGAALVLGVGIFLARQRWLAAWRAHSWVGRFGPAGAYEQTLLLLNAVAKWQTLRLQSGFLRQYQVFFLLSAVLALAGLWVVRPVPLPIVGPGNVHVFEAATAAAAAFGAAIALRAQSRLTAVVGLGVTGYSVALLFLLFGAPDLAMTQFAVETLTVVLFVLVLYRLPPFLSRSSRSARLRDALMSLAFGALVTLSLLSVARHSGASRLAPYFLEHSLPSGKGRNVVNVILVDFRSLDTLGEITVLGIAALGVAALLARVRRDS